MAIPEKLRALREAAGLSQTALAKKAGVSQQVISQLERGENLTSKFLPKIAFALGTTLAELDDTFAAMPSVIGPAVAVAPGSVTFAGDAQAGTWLAVDEYFQQDEYGATVPEFVAPVAKFRALRQYAYRIHGDSVNQVGIEDGMWVVAADAGDFMDKVGEVESGDLVVVERTRAQGAERELTIKEIRFYRDRYELLPRSTNPDHKPIVVPHDHKADDGTEVRIVGVVLTTYRDVFRKR